MCQPEASTKLCNDSNDYKAWTDRILNVDLRHSSHLLVLLRILTCMQRHAQIGSEESSGSQSHLGTQPLPSWFFKVALLMTMMLEKVNYSYRRIKKL